MEILRKESLTKKTDLEKKNAEILQIKEQTKKELASLQKEIKKWIEPSIIKGPEKMANGKILFDYKKDNQTREMITEKSWNTYKVRIKKDINGEWYTQKFWEKETFDFSATDKDDFNIKLWDALDKVIWKNRDKLPKTGGKVYELLKNWSTQKKEQKKTLETKNTPKIENTTKEKQREKAETQNMPKWLEKDHGTYIYTVQKWDSESKIKAKLKKYAPLSYLKDTSNGIDWYNFNTIPDKKLLPWLKIAIPKKNSERIKKTADFKKSQKAALDEMKHNSIYWNKIKNLLKKYSEDHIINVMTAYAISETSPKGSDKVWKFALFRYEKAHQCPSYGYHHILYKDAGLTAFKKAWISIGQSCNPKESWKLFLAFCIEKVKKAQKEENKDFTKFFNMKDTNRCARRYNWVDVKNYSTKLKANFNEAKNS